MCIREERENRAHVRGYHINAPGKRKEKSPPVLLKPIKDNK